MSHFNFQGKMYVSLTLHIRYKYITTWSLQLLIQNTNIILLLACFCFEIWNIWLPLCTECKRKSWQEDEMEEWTLEKWKCVHPLLKYEHSGSLSVFLQWMKQFVIHPSVSTCVWKKGFVDLNHGVFSLKGI